MLQASVDRYTTASGAVIHSGAVIRIYLQPSSDVYVYWLLQANVKTPTLKHNIYSLLLGHP